MPDQLTQRGDGLHLAILHYHLQPGGVTTVIEHTVAALEALGTDKAVVLSGRDYPGGTLANVETVPLLDYGENPEEGSAATLAAALEKGALKALDGRMPDIWHCHNHGLGKNVHLPDALELLIRRGHRLLLQIHDFAEDGRPDNFAILSRAKTPYPLHPAVHYATVNSRDCRLLLDAGLAESRVHHLPNPVVIERELPRQSSGGRSVLLYPTRGIRRKNMGEAVLLAALCQDRAFIATTRRPDNLRWRTIHDDWAAFAKRRRLPVAFAVVGNQSPADLQLSFENDSSLDAWLRAASCILTTSVGEGFGLVYLESLVHGRPLLGRDLPEITADFKERGFSFPELYRALRVPLPWLGAERVLEALRGRLKVVYQSYGRAMPDDAPVKALESMLDGSGRIDFGRLSEPFQRQVIDHVLHEDAGSDVMFETAAGFVDAVHFLERWFGEGMSLFAPARQRDILTKHYSRRAHAGRLRQCYQSLMSEPSAGPATPLDSEIAPRLLDAFLSPERFYFLKT